jgi:hypothetical protein
MTPELQKAFRINLLSQARAAGRLGQTVKEFFVNAKPVGFSSITEDQVREEIEYLMDKKHLAKVPQDISPEVESFRITDGGKDFLAVNKL